MKISPLSLALLLPALLVGAYLAYATPPLTVTGREHTYEVPRRLEKDYNSILYLGDIHGDDTGSTALLLFSHDDFRNIGLEDPWDATLLLFWDKDYSSGGRFVASIRGLIKHAEAAGRIGAFHRYRKSLGALQINYFLNFDPKNASDDQPNPYYVKVSKSEPVEVAGIRKRTTPGCALHSVHDGVQFEFTTYGPNCTIARFESLHAAVKEMFETWQK